LLKTGNQMKAARALAGISQEELAKRIGLHINTVSVMERRGSRRLASTFATVTAVREALQSEGVVFIDDGEDHGVGVMLASPAGKAPPSSARAPRPRKKALKAVPPKKLRKR